LRFACRITKATDTHTQNMMSVYLNVIILIAFPRRQRLRERPSTWRLYVHCLSFTFQ